LTSEEASKGIASEDFVARSMIASRMFVCLVCGA
jgi:hypothetical protein